MIDLETASYIDISPEIKRGIAVFPGDQEYRLHNKVSFEDSGYMKLSWMESTLHLGAHADGPCHYSQDGEGIGERSLHYYMGPCQVIDLTKKVFRGSKILFDDIEGIKFHCSRVLFKTETFDPYSWNDDFAYCTPLLLKELAKKGVKTVGIDTPSVDAMDSKTLDSHKVIAENNMAVLEGLNLLDAEDGIYQLVALPLKIKGGDASPVRAVLLR